jgi:hypothetical protein
LASAAFATPAFRVRYAHEQNPTIDPSPRTRSGVHRGTCSQAADLRHSGPRNKSGVTGWLMPTHLRTAARFATTGKRIFKARHEPLAPRRRPGGPVTKRGLANAPLRHSRQRDWAPAFAGERCSSSAPLHNPPSISDPLGTRPAESPRRPVHHNAAVPCPTTPLCARITRCLAALLHPVPRHRPPGRSRRILRRHERNTHQAQRSQHSRACRRPPPIA